MLQIASGKLFAGNPQRQNELRGVLYTNLMSYGSDPIDTAAGRLLATDIRQGIQSLVYEMTQFMEDPETPGGWVSAGITPYLSEFAAIVSFALNITCTPNQDLALRLTNGRPGDLVNVPPKQLVLRVFDPLVALREEDRPKLVDFVQELIGLKRRTFLEAMKAIHTYVTGLHRITDDFEIAYTLLVASIESLAHGFDGYRAEWTDYDEPKRKRVDQALANADEVTAERVRNAILENEHIALTRRFCNFALEHVGPSFFREEAADLPNPMGRSELWAALPRAYGLRSRYLHNLEKLPPLLTLPHAHHEVARIEGQILLTFQGLARLARHVITQFIEKQEKVEREPYDYRGERFGILQAPMAAQYWIGKTEGITAASGRQRFEGFLGQLAGQLQKDTERPITDLRDMLTEVESMLPKMTLVERRLFLALYFSFNHLGFRDLPMENYSNIHGKYWCELEGASVESAVVQLLMGTTPSWPLEKHQEIHDTHFSGIGRRNNLTLPAAFEVGMSLALAERYRTAGQVTQARTLISTAVENCPRFAGLRQLEKEFDSQKPIDWRTTVFGLND